MDKNAFQNGYILGYLSGGKVNAPRRSYENITLYNDTSSPFKIIDEPYGSTSNFEYNIKVFECSTSNMQAYEQDGTINLTNKSDSVVSFSKPKKCPKYLGFRIKGDSKQLYLYILKRIKANNTYVLDTDFILDIYYENGSNKGEINRLTELSNQFITVPLLEDDEDGTYDKQRYFIYRIVDTNGITAEGSDSDSDDGFGEAAIVSSDEADNIVILGSDMFPQGESDIIATTPQFIKNPKKKSTGEIIEPAKVSMESEKYYSVVLPSNCFYAILAKPGMPRLLKGIDRSKPSKATFNISYQTGYDAENNTRIINLTKGASFGVIPSGVGAALLRLPKDYNLNDIQIYTDKIIKSNDNFSARKRAKDLGKKIIKDFKFVPAAPIYWNDDDRVMRPGRSFYGIPYSSRWINSHYIGFEVSPETALNAFNDPYSIAYDGGCYHEYEKDSTTGETVRDELTGEAVKIIHKHIISGRSEIENIVEEKVEDGETKYTLIDNGKGPGYGLVCSAFTTLVNGNPYPQTNVGYTFDSNFELLPAMSMNSGQVLVNKKLSHCVFVDEVYNDGFSLYEAVDPCVTKTTHTCPANDKHYANSKVRNNYLEHYYYNVINKDTNGYSKIENWFSSLDELEPIEAPVRPWRGHKCVYGPWDVTESKGTGIGVTIHRNFSDGTTLDFTKFKLNKYNSDTNEFTEVAEIAIEASDKYKDITQEVKSCGNGTYKLTVEGCDKSTEFRYYEHPEVRLTFDQDGKAVFKNSDDSIAEDVEYVYIKVKGYGGEFANDKSLDQTKQTTMVIAAGKYYLDIAKDIAEDAEREETDRINRISSIRAAIVSDPNEDYWGKYSCITSSSVSSDYVDPIQQKITNTLGVIDSELY